MISDIIGMEALYMLKSTAGKRIILNLICIGVFLLVFIIANRVHYFLRYSIEETETKRVVYALVCGCLGVLYGFLNHFLPLKTMGESFKADRAKLLIWGVPLLFILFSLITYYRLHIIPNVIEIVFIESGVFLIFAFILGYTIVAGLFAESNRK